ncbi:unnamed protein product [Staurois parvus]|uniref:Transmembrane protein n=1 Tax=Staurois parvus TaxID=386267 RepID=A0ABN9GVS7_9NEOB|nr:unnamed protein product [Staurois parvus]
MTPLLSGLYWGNTSRLSIHLTPRHPLPSNVSLRRTSDCSSPEDIEISLVFLGDSGLYLTWTQFSRHLISVDCYQLCFHPVICLQPPVYRRIHFPLLLYQINLCVRPPPHPAPLHHGGVPHVSLCPSSSPSSVSHKSPVSDSCRTVSGSVMLHISSMSRIFLDSSSFFISRSRMKMETRSALPEMSLRTLFSRSSRRLLRSINRAVTLSVSPASSSSTFLLCSCRLWTLSSISSLFVRSFCRTFLSVSFFFSEAPSSDTILCPVCSPIT